MAGPPSRVSVLDELEPLAVEATRSQLTAIVEKLRKGVKLTRTEQNVSVRLAAMVFEGIIEREKALKDLDPSKLTDQQLAAIMVAIGRKDLAGKLGKSS